MDFAARLLKDWLSCPQQSAVKQVYITREISCWEILWSNLFKDVTSPANPQSEYTVSRDHNFSPKTWENMKRIMFLTQIGNFSHSHSRGCIPRNTTEIWLRCDLGHISVFLIFRYDLVFLEYDKIYLKLPPNVWHRYDKCYPLAAHYLTLFIILWIMIKLCLKLPFFSNM